MGSLHCCPLAPSVQKRVNTSFRLQNLQKKPPTNQPNNVMYVDVRHTFVALNQSKSSSSSNNDKRAVPVCAMHWFRNRRKNVGFFAFSLVKPKCSICAYKTVTGWWNPHVSDQSMDFSIQRWWCHRLLFNNVMMTSYYLCIGVPIDTGNQFGFHLIQFDVFTTAAATSSFSFSSSSSTSSFDAQQLNNAIIKCVRVVRAQAFANMRTQSSMTSTHFIKYSTD